MSNLIEEVKKEIEAKELEAKKEKIRKMLELISSREKNLDAILKRHEENILTMKDEIVRLNDMLEKEDYSAVSTEPFVGYVTISKNWTFDMTNGTWNIC